MNYEKLTPEKFNEKLKAGEYESLTGSRRAIGKASWPEADKEKCRDKALRHFGDNGSTPAKKAAPKAAPKKVAVKVVAAPKVKAKPGRKPAVAAQGGREHDKMEPKAAPILVPEHYTDVLRQAKNITLADVRKNPHAIIQLAEHGVQSGTNVLNALTAMKEKDPTLDISDTVDAATSTVKASLHLTSLVLQNLASGLEGHSHVAAAKEPVISHPVETEPTPSEVNGVASTVPGTPSYEAPTASDGE
jgi:hypothetical protein